MRSVKITALIETVSPSSTSLSVKRKKEDNETENYYTPPCLPSQLRQKSIGLLRRSLSENITPNKGFKKPRMLSDSGTPLSTRNNLISPPSSSSSNKETVKLPVVKSAIVDTPMEEVTDSSETVHEANNNSIQPSLPQSFPKLLPQQLFGTENQLKQTSPPINQQSNETQPKSEPMPLLQPSTQVLVQAPVKILAPVQIPIKILPKLLTKPNQVNQPQIHRQPDLKLDKDKPRQHPLSQLNQIKCNDEKSISISAIDPISSIEENEPKAELIPSGFKLANNKILFLNHSAQKRVEYLTKQLQSMDIDMSVYGANSKEKQIPVQNAPCPMKDISNVSKSNINPDTEDDFCDAADDEFLRNLDVDNLVGENDLTAF